MNRTPASQLRHWLRKPFTKTAFAAPVELDGRHIIVTGTSPDSLGFATARTLAQWGATVIVTTRRDSAGVAAQIETGLPPHGSGRVLGHDLDLCNAASVEAFVDWYQAQHGTRLDVLINNAGVHLDLLSEWKEPRLSEDGHEIQWRTNYLGSFHLTSRLLPLLLSTAEQSGDARVVNVSSTLHSRASNAELFSGAEPYSSWVAYGRSKLAMIHMANELQRRYSAQGLSAFSLHPGGVKTRVADKGLAEANVLSRVRQALAPLEALFLLNPEEGAQTQIHCATSPEAKGGHYYHNCSVTKASAEADDAEVAARLWRETQAWLESLPGPRRSPEHSA